MREIKFRAWDKRTKKMYPANIVSFYDDFSWQHGQRWIHNSEDWYGEEGFVSEPVLMQYTGLKDKNGKEIYEGDVVSFPDTYTETVDVGVGNVPVAQTDETAWGTVFMKDFQWGLDVQMDTEVLEKGFNSFFEINENFGLEDLEVIGNIYENPELLTPSPTSDAVGK